MPFDLDAHYSLPADSGVDSTMKDFSDDIAEASRDQSAPDPTDQTASNQPSSSLTAPREFHRPTGTKMAKPASGENQLAAKRGVDWEKPPQGHRSIDRQQRMWYYFYPQDEVTGYVYGNPKTGEPLARYRNRSVKGLRAQIQGFYNTIPDDTENEAKKELFGGFLRTYKTEEDFPSVAYYEDFSELRDL